MDEHAYIHTYTTSGCDFPMTAHNYIHHTKSVQQILGLHMRMPKPRAVMCEWAQEGLQLNRTWKCISGLWRLSTACTWLVKTPQLDFFFCTLSGFLLAFLASFVHQLSQCRQSLAVFSTQLCKTRMLRRPSCAVLRVLHCQELSSFHVLNLHRQCTWRMSFWASMHMSANSECKLTFLSVIRTYVCTYIARIDPSFEALR